MEVFLEKLKQFILSLNKFVEKRKPKPVIEYVPQEEIKEEPKQEFPKPLGWNGTKREVENEVRRVCQEENLSDALTQELLATLQAESAFDIKAVFKNKDGTEDLGICQYNTYWYIGKGKPIPDRDTALNNPEFCVRVMCKQFKRGRQKDWIAYKSGSYLRYIKNGKYISPN